MAPIENVSSEQRPVRMTTVAARHLKMRYLILCRSWKEMQCLGNVGDGRRIGFLYRSSPQELEASGRADSSFGQCP